MRTHPVKRVLAAFLLLWFAVVTVEPAALHACPVHSGAVPAAAESSDPHAGHGVSHAATAPGEGGHERQDHQCLCIGDCAAAVAAALLTATPQLTAAVAYPEHSGIAEPGVPRIRAPAFLLPYPNGPPAARIVA